jgi:hypothetical protein
MLNLNLNLSLINQEGLTMSCMTVIVELGIYPVKCVFLGDNDVPNMEDLLWNVCRLLHDLLVPLLCASTGDEAHP